MDYYKDDGVNAHELAHFLMSKAPGNATIRGYEGEISGMVVEAEHPEPRYDGQKKQIAIVHNSGKFEVLP